MSRDFSRSLDCQTAQLELSRRSLLLAMTPLAVSLTQWNRQLRADDAASENSAEKTSLQRVVYRDAAGAEAVVEGRVLTSDAQGGVLIEARSGRLSTLPASQVVRRESTGLMFQPLEPDELAATVEQEAREAGIESGFVTHRTDHFIVVATTGAAYAQWCGNLLERLQRAVLNFWQSRGLKLSEPEAPLPVLVLSNRDQFAKMAEFDRTPGSAAGLGYFLVTANRSVLFDLTTEQAASTVSSSIAAESRTLAQVARALQNSPDIIATVVHEATHQIAFNCGLHRRYADNPIWLTEGMAMYFETPDLKSRSGWQTIGRVSPGRLRQFADFANKRRATNSLETLLQDNSRFAGADLAKDAYAEAWTLSHFLIRTRGKQYAAYVESIAAKPYLKFDPPETRLADFRAAFGDDLTRTDQQFLAYARRLLQ